MEKPLSVYGSVPVSVFFFRKMVPVKVKLLSCPYTVRFLSKFRSLDELRQTKKVQSTLLLASKTLNAVDIARASSGEKSWQMKKLLGNLRGDSSASTSFSRFILLGHEPTSQPSLACRAPRMAIL